MAIATQPARDPILPDRKLRKASADAMTMLQRSGRARLVGPNSEVTDLPDPVYDLLLRALAQLAKGRAVSLIPANLVLTTQQAADMLNVSRPFFVKLLEDKVIPFHMVGTHRRVALSDVLEFRERRSNQRKTALSELAQESHQLGDYEV